MSWSSESRATCRLTGCADRLFVLRRSRGRADRRCSSWNRCRSCCVMTVVDQHSGPNGADTPRCRCRGCPKMGWCAGGWRW